MQSAKAVNPYNLGIQCNTFHGCLGLIACEKDRYMKHRDEQIKRMEKYFQEKVRWTKIDEIQRDE